ncbi:MAG: thioredoxin [Lutibacter sp.]|uniref:thioredoxin family protein n=1 Tax=Lutibacter sp. TaxID=1925666 RepID=UPI0019E6659C|nr:thioredoxin family protein [Lutibacter sp.]NOR28745.1 thioredoxin [Lutibacter sp.]
MNETTSIKSVEVLEKILISEIATLLYFNTQSCNVGESLEPKVRNLLKTRFPKINFYTVDINFHPEIAAKYTAFVEPTIIVFFEGKVTIKKSRNIGILELQEAIERPYKLIFE